MTSALGGFLDGEEGDITYPVPVFLVEHPRGLVLVDTGLHPDLSQDTKRLGKLDGPFRVRLPTDGSGTVGPKLSSAGFDPAQVDLDQRVHRNQETRDLGKMAFGILRAFLFRAEALGVIGDLPELNTLLRQFQVTNESFEQIAYEIVEEERPPMIEIPEYREKFKIG